MTALTHAEAAELLPVLVERIAQDADIRLLVVKGVAARHHALRLPKVSVDVDVLVDPARYDALLARLADLGWSRTDEGVPTVAPSWAATAMRHETWPLELDVHRSFPGVLAPAEQAFEALWADRVVLSVAGQPVTAAGWAGSALVAGLHTLRGRTEALAPELAQLLDVVRAARPSQRQAVLDLAAALGVTVTAAEVVEAAGGRRGEVDAGHGRAWQDWRLLHGSGSSVGLAWLMEFRRTAPWRWPALVLRALLGGSEAAVRARYPRARAGRRGLWTARWWRLRDSLPHLPSAVRRVLRARRARR